MTPTKRRKTNQSAVLAEMAAAFQLEIEDKLIRADALVEKHLAKERRPLRDDDDSPTPPPTSGHT